MSDVQPVCAQKSPYKMEVEAGQSYWWCACGKSGTQPFCDGSHKGSGFEPLPYVAERAMKVYFCSCKRSAKAPLCDGSHKALPLHSPT